MAKTKAAKREAPLNLTLFRRIRNRILRFPEAYDQEVYGAKSKKAPCGTRACLAGNALIEGGFCTPRELLMNETGWNPDRQYFRVPLEAAKLLGLSDSERMAFFAPDPDYCWPEPFQTRWKEAKTKEEQARVAADYINWIIRTDKVTD